jgi:hypothetical protein
MGRFGVVRAIRALAVRRTPARVGGDAYLLRRVALTTNRGALRGCGACSSARRRAAASIGARSVHTAFVRRATDVWRRTSGHTITVYAIRGCIWTIRVARARAAQSGFRVAHVRGARMLRRATGHTL